MLKPKIKILDWYIIKKFIGTYFFSLLIIIGIVIIFDLSEKLDKFVDNQAPLNAIIFDYFCNFIPFIVNMFSPLFVFITVIFFTSKLAGNSEIIAILSGGVSFQRLMVPYLVSAGIIAIFSFVLGQYVIPPANRTRLEFEQQYVKTSKYFNANRNIHYQIAPGEFVYVESFSSWNNTCYRFTLESVEDNKLKSKLSAESAVWDDKIQGWNLKNYFIRDYDEYGNERVVHGRDRDTVIALTLEDFYRKKNVVETLNAKELNALIAMQEMRGDDIVKYAYIEKHKRTAMPFSAFILTVMGVALSSRKRRGGIGLNIGIGIGLSFSYILFLRFSEMFVYTDTLTPFVALWMPNVLYTFIAYALYRLAPK
ncbi:MAG: YjgP/YjgQ family permease [Bacteroidales bacterium]|nr:YjgP/YjgQ family permease [Bacteroidales bacterium]